MNKTIRKIMFGGLALLAAARLGTAKPDMACAGQEPQEKAAEAAKAPAKPKLITFGYNALETALTQDRDVRNRLYSNVRLNLGPIFIGYHGLNEINNLRPSGYAFGRNTLYIGTGKTALALVTKADGKGVFDVKGGIRQFIPLGWLDLTFDKGSANLTSYSGIKLGKHGLLEIIQAAEIPFKAKASHYFELQPDYEFARKLFLFGRAEISNFDVAGGTYLVGLMKQF